MRFELLSFFLSELWFSGVKYILISHFLWKKCGSWKKSRISKLKVTNKNFWPKRSLVVTLSGSTTNIGQYCISFIFKRHQWNPQMTHFWDKQIFANFWTLVRRMEEIWPNSEFGKLFYTHTGKNVQFLFLIYPHWTTKFWQKMLPISKNSNFFRKIAMSSKE